MGDLVRAGYEKVAEAVWKNKESGLYYAFIDNAPWLVSDLALGEAVEAGVKKGDYEVYTAENQKIMAKRKKEFQEKEKQKTLDGAEKREAAPAGIVEPSSTRRVPAEVVRDLPDVVRPRDLVRPIASVDSIVEAFDKLQEIKRRVLVKDDFVNIGGKDVIRKSGLRKIKVAFGLDQKLLSEERRELNEEGEYEYTAYVVVTAPNGTFVEAKSSCSTIEPFGIRQKESTRKLIKDPNRPVKPEMIVFAVRGMAQTRAYNRAISDLIGGIDTSAEELGED